MRDDTEAAKTCPSSYCSGRAYAGGPSESNLPERKSTRGSARSSGRVRHTAQRHAIQAQALQLSIQQIVGALAGQKGTTLEAGRNGPGGEHYPNPGATPLERRFARLALSRRFIPEKEDRAFSEKNFRE